MLIKSMKKHGVRNREKIIVARSEDFPYEPGENGFNYDSFRQYEHDGYQRASVKIVSANAPMNNIVNSGELDKVTHQFRMYKHELLEMNNVIIWLDGIIPRLFKIVKLQQDNNSRRHWIVFCNERLIADEVAPKTTTYGGIVEY